MEPHQQYPVKCCHTHCTPKFLCYLKVTMAAVNKDLKAIAWRSPWMYCAKK